MITPERLSGQALTLGYRGTEVVTAASLSLSRGRVTALVGPNGSGKSTLLRALARLHRPTDGRVLVAGEPVAALSSREFAHHVALLAQNRPAPGGVSVRDVVGYGRHPYRGRWRANDPDGAQAIEWALDVTGTVAMADRTVDELSGGEAQRVWLATALAQRTDVLLLDEPTNHLDLRFQVEILDLIRLLADVHDVALGVVLHDLNHAAAVADEVVLLHRGTVVGAGQPHAVLTSAALTDVYGIRVDVTTDPSTGELFARPIGAHTQRIRQLA